MSVILKLLLLFMCLIPYFGHTYPPLTHTIQEWNAHLVNQFLAKWDASIIPYLTYPFDERFSVYEIQPDRVMYFVRFYTVSKSGPLGSFLVPTYVVRGLTPQQIQDKLALPNTPTHIVYVKVPANPHYGLWFGVARKIFSFNYLWGQGGGEQIKIIGPHTDQNFPQDLNRFADYERLPCENYLNPQLIDKFALQFKQKFKYKQTESIAKYLDAHIPMPFSDMDYIYTVLDFVKANNNGQLEAALLQISPINFVSFPFVLFHHTLQFEQNLFHHHSTGSYPINPWLSLSTEEGEKFKTDIYMPFIYTNKAIAIGIDFNLLANFTAGLSVIKINNVLQWMINKAHATIDNYQLGMYTKFNLHQYFLNNALLIGYSESGTKRLINFSGKGAAALTGEISDVLAIDRIASSQNKEVQINFSLKAGKNINLEDLIFSPFIRWIYFQNNTHGFMEANALDLNLYVFPYSSAIRRTELAMKLTKNLQLIQDISIKPNIQLAWAHDVQTFNGAMGASFPVFSDSFKINIKPIQTNYFLFKGKLVAKWGRRVKLAGLYNLELNHSFHASQITLLAAYVF